MSYMGERYNHLGSKTVGAVALWMLLIATVKKISLLCELSHLIEVQVETEFLHFLSEIKKN